MATIQRLSLMTVSEKIKAAMRGSREERTILIRDPNKLVSLAVLSSPKVNEREIESYAKMANVSEDVLRVIGTTRAWTKSYAVVRSLAFNPKSPIAVSMTLVSRLVEKDVRMLSTDRNIAEPVKILARKVVQTARPGAANVSALAPGAARGAFRRSGFGRTETGPEAFAGRTPHSDLICDSPSMNTETRSRSSSSSVS